VIDVEDAGPDAIDRLEVSVERECRDRDVCLDFIEHVFSDGEDIQHDEPLHLQAL
jgi:hypothetical protein